MGQREEGGRGGGGGSPVGSVGAEDGNDVATQGAVGDSWVGFGGCGEAVIYMG